MKRLFAFLLCLIPALAQAAPARPMTFTLVGDVIVASGRFAEGTAQDFETFLQFTDGQAKVLLLDSVGGNTAEALDVGYQVRKAGLKTAIGWFNGETGQFAPNGACQSMCAYVFLAGVERDYPEDASLEIHAIWPGDKSSDAKKRSYQPSDLLLVQLHLARIAAYLQFLNADMRILEEASKLGPWSYLHVVTPEENDLWQISTRYHFPFPATSVAVN